eukprot:1158735-Pelagomonas_calceolata.AAC.1
MWLDEENGKNNRNPHAAAMRSRRKAFATSISKGGRTTGGSNSQGSPPLAFIIFSRSMGKGGDSQGCKECTLVTRGTVSLDSVPFEVTSKSVLPRRIGIDSSWSNY